MKTVELYSISIKSHSISFVVSSLNKFINQSYITQSSLCVNLLSERERERERERVLQKVYWEGDGAYLFTLHII